MRRIKLLLAGLLLALPLVAGVAVAHAQDNFRSGNDVTVAVGEMVDRTLFAAGSTIDIAGTVNGDVFCAGQSVTISGTVRGDVICAGQTIQLTGRVDGNVRIAGQTVTVSGLVTHNASIAGQTFTLDSPARISGDASVAGENSTLNGFVGRDLYAGSSLLTINGSIGRDINSGVTSLVLGPSAIVRGDITYISAKTFTRDASAQVGGTISRHNPPKDTRADMPGVIIGGSFGFALFLLVSLLVVALAVILLIPRFVHDATEVAISQPLKTLLVGFLSHVLAPVAFLALLFTVVGIPLGALALLAWFLISCLAFPFAAYYLGSLLISKSTNNVIWIMLLGAGVIALLYMIPFIGFLTWLAVTWFGTGIMLLQVPRLPRPRYIVAAK